MFVNDRTYHAPEAMKKAAKLPHIREPFADQDGYWAHTEPGWKSASDPHGACHTIHEWNVREFMRACRDLLPCNCDACKKAIANGTER